MPAAGAAGITGGAVGAADPGAAVVGDAVGDTGPLVGEAVGVLVGEAVGVLAGVGAGVESPPRFCLAAAGAASALSTSASRQTCRHHHDWSQDYLSTACRGR